MNLKNSVSEKYTVMDKHYKKLEATVHDKTGWPEGSPFAWFKWVKDSSGIALPMADDLPERANRHSLKEMTLNEKIQTDACCISILAWGGMNRKHGAMLFSSGRQWLLLSDEIRNGKYDRSEAYDRFSRLRDQGLLPGMGPAYFTKLIFFLMLNPKDRGLIMDQWTSASVNLLSGSELVKMNRGYFKLKNSRRLYETVSDSNTSENYENYCKFVEGLSQPDRLGVDVERVEEMLFSQGRGVGSWRNHVIENREAR